MCGGLPNSCGNHFSNVLYLVTLRRKCARALTFSFDCVAGFIFFASPWLPFNTAIWHVFVLAAAAAHLQGVLIGI